MTDEIADVLEDAADLLEDGWIQNTYYLVGAGYCSIGALGTVINNRWLDDGFEDEKDILKFEAAVDALKCSLNGVFKHLGDGPIIQWNDMEGRTKQEVLDAFRKAAKEQRGVHEG